MLKQLVTLLQKKDQIVREGFISLVKRQKRVKQQQEFIF